MKRHPIFNSIELWGKTLSNRLVVAPMSRVSSTAEGLATQEMKEYYSAYAEGGFAVIITEGIYTASQGSQGYPNQPGLANEEQVNAWKPVVTSVQKHKSLIIGQLMHAGALSQFAGTTYSASAIQPKGSKLAQFGGSGLFEMPQKMSVLDIENAINGFVDSARNAFRSGFDGIELHGANGYLLDQFLTPELNTRKDDYGGSLEGNTRIIKEIVQKIRVSVPEKFILGLRLSEGKVNELGYRWKNGHVYAKELLEQIKTFAIDYVHVAVQTGEWERDSFYQDGSSLASLTREVTGLPVIVNGGMQDMDRSARALNDGHAELVAIGKAALADQAWPKKIASGIPAITFHRDMLWPEVTISNSRKTSVELEK